MPRSLLIVLSWICRPSRFKQAVKVFIVRVLGAEFSTAVEASTPVAQIASESTPELPALISHAPNSMGPLISHMDGMTGGALKVVRLPMGREQVGLTRLLTFAAFSIYMDDEAVAICA